MQSQPRKPSTVPLPDEVRTAFDKVLEQHAVAFEKLEAEDAPDAE
jgi:hypothetical protein